VNVREYIESGILEAYVLDALSADEHAAVAANISLYPELAEEVATIEAAVAQYAETTAIEPPLHLQEEIWHKIEKNYQDTPQNNLPPDSVHASKTISLNNVGRRDVGWQRAAVWVALAGSLLVNIMLWSQRNAGKGNEAALAMRLDTMQKQQLRLASLVQNYEKARQMMADTGMQTIVMHTIQKGHPMAATIYWEKRTGAAYVSIDKLPLPPKGMQYQMWVMQNGKPVDMGVIANDLVASAGMDKVNMNVNDGQAFAISLEKEGGSPTPTMENIYVMGKVSS
jgi:anti-sigma-K factor RskA